MTWLAAVAMAGRVSPTRAAMRTVTLAVDNMYCASCPFIVKEAIADVAGVSDVTVSFESKTATVTFDETVTDVASLAAASASAGYPAREATP